MKTLSLVLLSLLFCGCTTVIVEDPVGQILEDEETRQNLVGKWMLGDGSVFSVSSIADSRSFEAEFVEDGETKKGQFMISKVSVEEEVARQGKLEANRVFDDLRVIWWSSDEYEGYVPLRLLSGGGEGGIVLLFPDSEEIEAMVQEGLIKAKETEEKYLVILMPEELEEALSSKRFWELREAIALVKEPSVSSENQGEEQ